jgi:RNA polymerase sigma factor (sigma-70 family)
VGAGRALAKALAAVLDVTGPVIGGQDVGVRPQVYWSQSADAIRPRKLLRTLGVFARSRVMRLPTASRTTVWATAISVSALAPHAAPIALGLAVAKEGFDLLHAWLYRATVLSYIRAAAAGTYLSIDPSGVAPGLTLQAASPFAGFRGDEEGAVPVPADNEPSRSGADPDPGDFCIKHRADWLSYALAHARNLQDAEDAVSHAGEKILLQHAETGMICPGGYDPEAWAKTVIRNYICDLYRHSKVQVKYQARLHTPADDFVENLMDEILARQMFSFIKSLRPGDHQIAVMHYLENLKPSVIAEMLGRKEVTVRTSLWRTRVKMRRELGVTAKSQVVIPRRETT